MDESERVQRNGARLAGLGTRSLEVEVFRGKLWWIAVSLADRRRHEVRPISPAGSGNAAERSAWRAIPQRPMLTCPSPSNVGFSSGM
jgi:hypothetical protein